jgi:anti-anti-sigma regulatory factor
MSATLSVTVRPGGPSAGPGESLVVAIGGELDIATAPQFAARFDATGLRALTTLRTRAEERLIAVRLSGASPQMRRLMSVIGPARDFPASY